MPIEEVIKHLPGKHSQASHAGSRKRSGGGDSRESGGYGSRTGGFRIVADEKTIPTWRKAPTHVFKARKWLEKHRSMIDPKKYEALDKEGRRLTEASNNSPSSGKNPWMIGKDFNRKQFANDVNKFMDQVDEAIQD